MQWHLRLGSVYTQVGLLVIVVARLQWVFHVYARKTPSRRATGSLYPGYAIVAILLYYFKARASHMPSLERHGGRLLSLPEKEAMHKKG